MSALVIIALLILGGATVAMLGMKQPKLALITAMPALLVYIESFGDIQTWMSWLFWVSWVVAGVVCVMTKASAQQSAAVISMSSLLLFNIVLIVFAPAAMTRYDEMSQVQVIALRNATGTVQKYQLVVNKGAVNVQNPVVGTDANRNPATPPSVKDDKGAIRSWQDLESRVNALPEPIRSNYIKSWNALNNATVGQWDMVPIYVKAERFLLDKFGVKSDLRVILVINTSKSDEQVRDALRPKLSTDDAANWLPIAPIVRLDGALLNTRGVELGLLEEFADWQSQIRVLLTTPTESGPNIEAAKLGFGVLTECLNVGAGMVAKPVPTKVWTTKTPPATTTVKTTSTTPSTSTTTTVPSSSTTTTPPVTTTTKPSTTTTIPSTTTTTQTTSSTTTTVPTTTTTTSTSTTTTPPVTTTTTPSSTTTTPPVTTTTAPKNPSDSIPIPGLPTGTTEPNTETVAPTTTAAPTTTRSTEAPISQAPDPTTPGSGDVDPDTGENTLAALFLPLGLLGFSAVRRRKLASAAA